MILWGIDSRRVLIVEVGRCSWILDIISFSGFVEDLFVGCERKRGVKVDFYMLI